MIGQTFMRMTCRKCEAVNPLVYFAPVVEAWTPDDVPESGSCVCVPCAIARRWATRDGDLMPGVVL